MTAPLIRFYQQELKDRPLMPELLAQAGIDVPHNRLIRVPIYPDRNPSAYVYAEHITDYGDNNKGYDLLAVAREWLNLTLEDAVGLLASLAGIQAPVTFKGEVKRVTFRPLAPLLQRDPNEYASLAQQAERALWADTTAKSQGAWAWLDSRGLVDAAAPYRLGIIDATTSARLPGSIWGGFLTVPSWLGGQLIHLQGRNFLPKGEGREMRNLGGAGVAVFGLELATATPGDVIVVEGQTDCMSVHVAFEGEVPVVGLPGATHWSKLQHPALQGRRLILALDTDQAGEQALEKCRRWAAEEGRAVLSVRLGDKNDLLTQHGPDGLRSAVENAIKNARVRAARRFV